MDTNLFFLLALCGLLFETLVSNSAAQEVTNATSLPRINDCSLADSVRRAQIECFTREGLAVELPKESDEEKQKSIPDVVLNSIASIQQFCSDLSRYQRGSECAMKVPLECMLQSYWEYVPSATNIRRVLSMWCDNLKVTDLICMKSVAPQLYACGYDKGSTYSSGKGSESELKDLLCHAGIVNAECQLEVMPTCGCRITRLQVEIEKSYFNPPACSPVTVKTPECRLGTDEFINSGAIQRTSPLALCALFLCAMHTTA